MESAEAEVVEDNKDVPEYRKAGSRKPMNRQEGDDLPQYTFVGRERWFILHMDHQHMKNVV